jgi:hypothetical protein
MGKRYKKEHRPTGRSSELVEGMVAAGIEETIIAEAMNLTLPELKKHYVDELQFGVAKANARSQATCSESPRVTREQAVSAAVHWLNNRANWKTKSEHALTGPDGRPIETASVELSPEALEAIRKRYIED